MGLKTSTEGISLIKKFEGCRLEAYKDSVGVWTIGYGHTAGVKAGQRITQAQAESFLKDDLAKFEREVMKHDDKYHWNQNQFDALVSFAFNIGNINQLTANGSRSVQAISEKMLQYNKAGGKVLGGLTERRKKERELFLKPAQQNLKAASVNESHVQLNYQQGQSYTVDAEGLRIRTKKAFQSPDVLPDGTVIGNVKNRSTVKNLATARVGDQIWMYIGLDKQNREQWICADTGEKAYIK